IVIGAGGIHTEILSDTAAGLCPVRRLDAFEMIEALRIAPMLKGLRGRPPADLGRLVDLILALGGEGGLFGRICEQVPEFEINPLIVGPDGGIAVDARM